MGEDPGYYVYHSSAPGEPEFHEMPESGEDDLTDFVREDYLYGGYYKTAGKKEGKYVEGQTEYSKGDPYTASGMELHPTEDTVYYLKEVDQNYLKPQVYLIYSKIHDGLIQGLYGLVNVDSNEDYSTCGLSIDGAVYPYDGDKGLGALAESIVVTRNDNPKYATIDRTNFGTGFIDTDAPIFIGGINLQDMIAADETIQISAYYVTQDGIKVTGYKDRMLQFAEGDSRYDGKPCFKGWNDGHTQTGLVAAGPSYEPYGAEDSSDESNAGPTAMTTRSRLTIAAPADTINYTISKVYGSEKETQSVEGGNQVGKITYTEKAGYTFGGWYEDEALTIPADFSNVQADMTVYARYISSNDITLSYSPKKTSDTNVVFNVTVGVKNIGDFKEVGVICSKDGTETEDVLKTKSTKKTGSGKNRVYTYCYKGNATVQDLSKGDTFVSTIYWVTPDGTRVTGETHNCTYWLGFVKVK